MNTPPKTISVKSTNGVEIKSRYSVDQKVANKQKTGNKTAFENKIRQLMEKSDNDR